MQKIGIIGCGNMGLIYAHAFLKYKIIDSNHLYLIEKNAAKKKSLEKLKIGKVNLLDTAGNCDILIVAVKPQDYLDLSKSLKKFIQPHQLLISIMAGINIATIQKTLQTDRIVRAMPNSPCELGMGMTGIACSSSLSLEEIHQAEKLLSATGKCIFFEEEKFLDAVTALSGSGPAYFFYWVQHFIAAGIQMGLSENIVETMVKQTMQGAFHLIQNADKPLSEMISSVASKGGTTEAALKVFEKNNLGNTIELGIIEAYKRAQQLAACTEA